MTAVDGLGLFVASLSERERRHLATVLQAGVDGVSGWSRRHGLPAVEINLAVRVRETLVRGPGPEGAGPGMVPLSELEDLAPAATLRRWCVRGLVRAERVAGRWVADPASVAERATRRAVDGAHERGRRSVS